MLREGRLDDVAALSDEAPNVVSAVVSRLYEADALTRFRAADALGRTCSRMADRNRTRVEELLKKLAWSLNEESGATAWGAPQAIGEVARGDADWAREYMPLLVSYLDHDDTYLETGIMVHGVLYALGRLGERYSSVDTSPVEALIGRLGDEDATTRAMAIEALGRFGDPRAKQPLLALTEDTTQVEHYVDGTMASTDVATLARASLESLRG